MGGRIQQRFVVGEGSERAERRKECKEHVDDEFRQQIRELIEEVKEQINREEVERGVESSDINEEREAEAERESTEIDEGPGGDDEFRREMQELIAEVREISEKEESEDSDEFRKQMRELIDEVKKELEADGALADSAEDRLDEFEEDILENFEKYGIDGDEVRERWHERFIEDVEEELEKDPASDELDESTNTSDDAADSEVTGTAESYSYSECGDGTVQVLKTEGSSETTEDESKEHKAEMEPQSESDLSVEDEKNRAIEDSNQEEDLESPNAEKHPEKQITHETESDTSENNTQHELKRNSKERSPETSENAQARQQTSETVSESSEEKAEAAERKDVQAKSIETHSPRAECEELAEEEVEDTQAEGHLNESDEEESEVAQDSGLKSKQEWKEDGESEELADSEHLEEPDSTQSTSESYQEVLEENISPDAEELDEDEEVDERVASDDEGLTGMLHSPYPKVYVDETGFFAETEEQRWRRKLIELYNELPEEMKQLYRELVKAMLESEEGLEKLLDTFSELKEYEDFEEEHAGAIKYVKFRQKVRELKLLGTQGETTVKELALELDIDQETVRKWLNDDYNSFPKIIQEVWKQEIERRWVNVLRAIANRDVPYDMGEVNEILKQFPELKRKRHFGWHYDEVKSWTEVMAAKRRGEIATLIIQGKERFKVDEVEEMAKRFNLTVDKVVRWLRDESRPQLINMLTEKRQEGRMKRNGAIVLMEKGAADPDSSANSTRRRNPILRTWKEYEEALKYHPKLKMKKSFDKAHSEVRTFYALLEALQSDDVDLSGFAEEHGLSLSRAFDWSREENLPKLLELLEGFELRRLFERLNGGPPEVPIKSMEDVKRLLQKYPDLQQDSYENCEKYFEVKDDWSRTQLELAEIYGVSKDRIVKWRSGQGPPVIAKLRRFEQKRVMSEWAEHEGFASHRESIDDDSIEAQSRVTFGGLHRIPQSKVREISLRIGHEKWTYDGLTDVVEQLCKSLPNSTSRVFYSDFRSDLCLTPEQFENLEHLFQVSRDSLEQTVRERLGFEKDDGRLRLGFADGRLYIWKPDLTPMRLINAYGTQFFYFDKDELARFMAEIKGVLEGTRKGGVYSTIEHLNDLLPQMTSKFSDRSFINKRYNRVRGDSLSLLVDLSGRVLADFEGRISKITGHNGQGGIRNPKFPDGEDLRILVARIIAIVVSDCHLRPNGAIEYFEPEIERIRIVERILKEFGDIELKPVYIERDNVYTSCFPSPIGKALQYWSLSPCDKTVQNAGFDPALIERSWRASGAFMEELIPQDGTVKSSRMSWTHSHALHPGNKIGKFGVFPIISQEEANLIIEHGEPGKNCRRLSMGKLIELKGKSHQIAQIAAELEKKILRNPNNLINDEKRIAENLGVKVVVSPYSIRYHQKTGRVSVSWVARTANIHEAMKLAMVAPPNDVKKRKIMRASLKSKPDEVRRIHDEFADNGIDLKKWWIEDE